MTQKDKYSDEELNIELKIAVTEVKNSMPLYYHRRKINIKQYREILKILNKRNK